MTAQIIQFIPRPRKVAPISNPIDFAIWYADATADWLKQLNEFADTTPYQAPEKEPA